MFSLRLAYESYLFNTAKSEECEKEAAAILKSIAGNLAKEEAASGQSQPSVASRLPGKKKARSSDSTTREYLRRMKTRLGNRKAVTATAHKLGVIIYKMVTTGKEYSEMGGDYYDKLYRNRVVKSLKRRAEALGLEVVDKQKIA